MDLAHLSPLSKYNDTYKYLLNVIDIFSRYAWSVPLKDTGKSIAAAKTTLFQNRKPNTIQSDKGAVYVNATVQQYLKRQGIDFYRTQNPDIKGLLLSDIIEKKKKKCINISLRITRTATWTL
jgi:transposase InsO family protein